jgi:hypothetical protein
MWRTATPAPAAEARLGSETINLEGTKIRSLSKVWGSTITQLQLDLLSNT